MNRLDVIAHLASVGVSAAPDKWSDSLVEMPDGIFYDANDFSIKQSYTDVDGVQQHEPCLVYDGPAEFNVQFWPINSSAF